MLSDINYLSEHKEYTQILQQKNHLLRAPQNRAEISTWNDLLSQRIVLLSQKRQKFIAEVNIYLKELSKQIFKRDLGVEIDYNPSLAIDFSGDIFEVKKRASNFLAQKLEVEKKRQRSLYGSHLDFYNFRLEEGKDIAGLSSGEYRKIFYLLQFCLAQKMGQKQEVIPVFLLDDIFAELDKDFREQLLDYVKEIRSQIFISVNDKNMFRMEDSIFFEVENGRAKIEQSK